MKRLILILILLSAQQLCLAQLLISGRVVSANDLRPLPGAVVKVKGSLAGVSADARGTFTIALQPHDKTLVISFIGYHTLEVPVSSFKGELFTVALEPAINALNEVVISTGIQDIAKERSTGSVVQVSSDDLNKRVSPDILSRLEHIVPGLVVNRGKGGAAGLRIRGQSTIFAEAEPLIVVDNFPFEGDINNINPNDVESITVLKDAAAASIWGARSGNGVIVITTRKARGNAKPQFSFSSSMTSGAKPDQFYHSRMSSADFIENEKALFEKGFYKSRELSPYRLSLSPVVELLIARRDGILSAAEANQRIDQLKGFDVRQDFDKYLHRRSLDQQYSMSMRGGTGNHSYSFSSGFDKNISNLVGNESNRLTLDLKNTLNLMHDKVSLSAQLSYSALRNQLNNPGASSIIMTPATGLYPYARLADEHGAPLPIVRDYRESFLQDAEEKGLLNWRYFPLNELQYADNKSQTEGWRFNTAVKVRPIPELNAEVRYQYGSNNVEGRNLRSQDSYYTRDLINQVTQVNMDGNIVRPVPLGGILDTDRLQVIHHNVRGQLNFEKQWGPLHHVTAMVGGDVQQNLSSSVTGRLYGYDDEHATSKIVDHVSSFSYYYNPSFLRTIETRQDRRELTDRYIAYFLNAGYSFNNRYTLSVSARSDKSNLFGVKTNQKGVALWSAGLGWNLGEENFYKLDWLPFIKMRLSYGYNGNVDKKTSAYTTATYNAGNTTPTLLPYATISNPPNPQLRWERIRIINGGLDFESRGGMISGSIDVFSKKGLDLIGSTAFPASTGITSFRGNTASTKGRGIDLLLNTRNVDKIFKWHSNIILSYVTDRVTDYSVQANAGSYITLAEGVGTYPFVGKPVYALYSYPWAGLDPATGELQGFLNGDLTKDYAKVIAGATPENIIYHGAARPAYSGAVANTLSWKNLSLTATVAFKAGYYFRRPSVRFNDVLSGLVSHGDYALRWRQPGDELRTNVPSLPAAMNTNRDNLYTYSEILVERGDHLRLQDVNINYELGKPMVRKLGIERAQIFVYSNNLGLLWKATDSQLDPDYLSGVPPRTLAAGIRVDF